MPSLVKVSEVVSIIGACMDDPSNLDFDNAYCLPFINLAWQDLSTEMAALGLDYEEVVAEISNVPAGTKELSAYQADGQVLESMILPLKVEWKRVGEDETRYAKAADVKELPDVQDSTEGITAVEWRGGTIHMTPSAIAVDLRIRFKAYSLNFVDPVDGMMRGVSNIIAYTVCEMLCAPTVRNNAQGLAYFANKAQKSKDEFEVLCVKRKSRQVTRFGRISGRHRGSIRLAVHVASSSQDGTMITRHTPANLPDGIRTEFEFAGLPNSPVRYQVYVNGLLTTSGFTQNNQTLIFDEPLPAETELYVNY